ncbi:MAG: Cell division protein FtsZ [Alphaproteobacteria bacterium ADurb.Bin438]|nr:MAG: Cell division protein FtsZ [Alphaproteobacteria bacterium ADurb.Bin438]
MSIIIAPPENQPEAQLTPKIAVIGVGGAGGNAVNNMIESGMEGVRFIVANTDAQALQMSKTSERLQLGISTTGGLGAGSKPEVGKLAAEETEEKIAESFKDLNMLFITAGMGGGTGTGAAPIVAKLAKEQGILTVAVVTKPFHFEGKPRMRTAEAGIKELEQYVDTLLIIPNQKLFSLPGEDLTIQDAFKKVDDVLSCGIKSITDLIINPGTINLDFADVKTAMEGMGKAMMGTGEESGEDRALRAAEKAITNPLLDSTNMSDAKAIMINITCGPDLKISEIDRAVTYIKDSANEDTNVMHGLRYDQSMGDVVRISVVATGIKGSEELALNKDVSKPNQAIINRKIPFHTSDNRDLIEKTKAFVAEKKEEVLKEVKPLVEESKEEVVVETKLEEIQKEEVSIPDTEEEIIDVKDEIIEEEPKQSSVILSMPSAKDLFKSISTKAPEQQTMPFISPQIIPMSDGEGLFKSHAFATKVNSKNALNQTKPSELADKIVKEEVPSIGLNAKKDDIFVNPSDKPVQSSIIEEIPSFFNEKIPSFFGRK